MIWHILVLYERCGNKIININEDVKGHSDPNVEQQSLSVIINMVKLKINIS